MNSRALQAQDLLPYSVGDRSGPLSRLLSERSLAPFFQPIAALAGGAVDAHESLIRGPGACGCSPRCAVLRGTALRLAAGLRSCLRRARHAALVALQQHGRIFVNISASVYAAFALTAATPSALASLDLAAIAAPAQLAMQPVARGAGFVHHAHLRRPGHRPSCSA